MVNKVNLIFFTYLFIYLFDFIYITLNFLTLLTLLDNVDYSLLFYYYDVG